MKELTRAEEQIMQILWKLEKGFVKDIIDSSFNNKLTFNRSCIILCCRRLHSHKPAEYYGG